MAETNFASKISDAELQVESAGYKLKYWKPEFGWDDSEKEASQKAHAPQLLAALMLFIHLFIAAPKRAWVHLAAEMQAGKTGVITTLIRLVLGNVKKLNIKPDRIFVITGMNDDAWKKQTRERMPKAIRDGIHHNKGLTKIAAALKSLAGSEYLSNVLIIIDESHIAAKMNNQPNKQIFQTLKELCPVDQWEARNIRIVTISATDPTKVLAINDSEMACTTVQLLTDAHYQSIEKLKAANRIRYLEDFGSVSTASGMKELKRCVVEDFESKPLYHIVRSKVGKMDDLETAIKAAFPDARVIIWDAASKAKKVDDDGSSTATMDDINKVLKDEPTVMTFILLKNMFYASKTLEDKHVGIMYDRIGSKDDTNLQSLIGRACGYGRSQKTIVYTSRQTIDNYISCWRELCTNTHSSPVFECEAKDLDNKMTGVRAASVSGGAEVSASAAMANPYTSVAASDAKKVKTLRENANENNYTSVWLKFKTLEGAKAHAPRSHTPKMVDGFYHCCTTDEAKKVRIIEIMGLKAGKKTANMPWNKMKVGQTRTRLYVAYKDENNANSARFFVRKLTRNA